MNVFFDVDGTIAALRPPHSVRPGCLELFRLLKAEGRRVFLWSGAGVEHARRFARLHGLDKYLDGYYEKGARITQGDKPHVCIDDHPYDIPLGVVGVVVEPFLFPSGEAEDNLVRAVRSFLQELNLPGEDMA